MISEFMANCRDLAEAKVEFTVYHPGHGNAVFHIAAKDLTNDQLRVITDLGGQLIGDGSFRILTSFDESQ